MNPHNGSTFSCEAVPEHPQIYDEESGIGRQPHGADYQKRLPQVLDQINQLPEGTSAVG